MGIQSIRIPDELEQAIQYVSGLEKIEKSNTLRKLARMGFETYLAQLYRQGRLTLRECAAMLQLTLSETIDLFAAIGVKGNIETSTVLESLHGLKQMQSQDSSNIEE